ncbi:MAG TPA: hypothetical protein VNV42_09185 [Solirubrobacteraceae bacterium]|nr:hypothetical protein [Solirubrobacteraceae bacterium]
MQSQLAHGEPTLVGNRYSTLPGLPDGRVYEEVSPANKHGNTAGVTATLTPLYTLATADGNGVFYKGSGAFGSDPVNAVFQEIFVARRVPGVAWTTTSPDPRFNGTYNLAHAEFFEYINPSADLSHLVFSEDLEFVHGDPPFSASLYLAGPNNALEPEWVDRPQISDPSIPFGAKPYGEFIVAGGSPSLSRIYYGFSGTLLPEDESRALYAGTSGRGSGGKPRAKVEWAWGFYEWDEGSLHEADTLPDGSLSPFGAVPAATTGQKGNRPYNFDNQVSEDGSKAFFVSPDPGENGKGLQREEPYGSGHEIAFEEECPVTTPGGCILELYVRETLPDGQRGSVLVSRDTLAPPVEGQPARAPHGALAVPGLRGGPEGEVEPNTYVYASPDGSQAFFASDDKLARSAAGEEPSGSGPWEYDFDTDTETLTYLPGVASAEGGAKIVGSSRDGSRFYFLQGEGLDMWSQGLVSTIAAHAGVEEARATPDGSVLVFWGGAAGLGFNSGGFLQVYRYDASKSTLDCVSCPPTGVVPSGNAEFSADGVTSGSFRGAREISEGGDRVFFNSPDPLVPQDTDGKGDLYEWEDGTDYLISAGTGFDPSFYLDSSANGGDVFFGTAEGLVPGDTDGAWDVYDARVPQPGDNPPPTAVPCQGDVCQGPPSIPQLLTAPASETFSGLGNVPPQPTVTAPKAKAKTKAKAKAKAKVKVKRRRTRSKSTRKGGRGRARRAAKSSRRGGKR